MSIDDIWFCPQKASLLNMHLLRSINSYFQENLIPKKYWGFPSSQIVAYCYTLHRVWNPYMIASSDHYIVHRHLKMTHLDEVYYWKIVWRNMQGVKPCVMEYDLTYSTMPKVSTFKP